MPGGPVLGLLTPDMSEFRVVQMPEEVSWFGGLVGLTASQRFLFAITALSESRLEAARKPSPSCLLIFDRRDLTLLNRYICRSIFDAHSICLEENALYVVSAGTDEVVELTLRDADVVSEQPYWRPDPDGPHRDVHHLNAIHRWQGGLLVSGFGKRSGPQWSSATDGFIVNIATGEYLATGLYQPHSLIEAGEALAYCESSRMAIRLLGSERQVRVPGYARGLCRIGDKLLAGTSRGRRVSKSTGVLTNRGDFGPVDGRCCVARLSIPALEMEQVIELDAYGWEIYDLLPIGGVAAWPCLAEVEWRDAGIRGLRDLYDDRDATASWLHVEVAKRDDAVAELRGELAGLHGEVAERDETIERLRGQAAGLHTRFAEQHRELERLHVEVAKRDETIGWLDGEVANRDRLIAHGGAGQHASENEVERRSGPAREPG